MVAGIAKRALGIIADAQHLAPPPPPPQQRPGDAREVVEADLLRHGVSAHSGVSGRTRSCGSGTGAGFCVETGCDCEHRCGGGAGGGACDGAAAASHTHPQLQRQLTAAHPGAHRYAVLCFCHILSKIYTGGTYHMPTKV